jgi:hypothetical protein
MGRAPTKDDYVKLVEALPRKLHFHFYPLVSNLQDSHTDSTLAGTNWNAIRQRFSKLRKDQAKRFEELGWDLPDGAASKTPTKTPAKTTPKKRAAGGEEAGNAETESPTKKPRARKPKKEVVKKEVEEDDVGGGAEVEDEDVKEELIDEDV